MSGWSADCSAPANAVWPMPTACTPMPRPWMRVMGASVRRWPRPTRRAAWMPARRSPPKTCPAMRWRTSWFTLLRAARRPWRAVEPAVTRPIRPARASRRRPRRRKSRCPCRMSRRPRVRPSPSWRASSAFPRRVRPKPSSWSQISRARVIDSCSQWCAGTRHSTRPSSRRSSTLKQSAPRPRLRSARPAPSRDMGPPWASRGSRLWLTTWRPTRPTWWRAPIGRAITR